MQRLSDPYASKHLDGSNPDWYSRCEPYHFGQELLTVGPVEASDAQEVGVERLVKHFHVIPLEQEQETHTHTHKGVSY